MIDDITENEIEFLRKLFPWAQRALRGLAYFAIAWCLTRVNTYGIPNPTYLALAIGVVGAGSNSARIGQYSLIVLFAMALIPTTHLLEFYRALV
jgi:hypothetical protein